MLQSSREQATHCKKKTILPARYDKKTIFFQAAQRFVNHLFCRHPKERWEFAPIHAHLIVELSMGKPGTKSLNAHRHPETLHFQINSLSKAIDPGFSRTITDVERAGKETCHGRDINYVSIGTTGHDLKSCMGKAFDGDDVEAVHPILGLHSGLKKSSMNPEAGVVHEKVEIRCCRDARLHGFQLGFNRQICRDCFSVRQLGK